MAGPNVWIAPYATITADLENRARVVPPGELQARCAALQARATIEAKVAQERSNEQLVAATTKLVEETNQIARETRRLVRSTYWVAGGTALAAFVAAGAAIVAASIAAG